MKNRTPEQAALVAQISREVSPGLAQQIDEEFSNGRSLADVVAQMRRIITALEPIKQMEYSISPQASRTETEISLYWGKLHPELFVEAFVKFQNRVPVTHWQHRIDLSRDGFVTLIAIRRDQPFESIAEYVAAGNKYNKEIGFDV